MADKTPLVIVQCDAFDPVLTQQWMDSGAMPTFAALRSRGVQARLSGPELVAELGMARSMYSGVSRSKHGYYDYRQLESGTYDLRAMASTDSSVAPFWSVLRDATVVTIDAGEVAPVDGLRGLQLANWTAHQSATRILPPNAVPSDALAEVRRSFGPADRVLEFMLGSTPDDDRPILTTLLDRVRRKGALCRQFVGDGADLVVVGFFEGHTAGHRFWKYQQGRASGGALSNAMRDVYSAIDREVGELLEKIPNANVALVSLFGMRDEYPTEGLLENFCRTLGYQASPRSSGASSRSLRSIVGGMLPEFVRTAISRRLPAETQERMLADAFRSSTDWSRTNAFSIPSLYTGHIRINVRGREPMGIVDPGKEYRDVVERIEHDLLQIEDPITGSRAIRAVHHTRGLFGDDLPQSLPDLFVEWEPAPHFRARVIHPRGELQQQPPAYFRDSFHSLEGFMIASGPDVHARGTRPSVDVLDVAPTFLSLLGRPAPGVMTGSASRTLLEADAR